jgi:LPS export ABC transporter permease LptG/LPS export ABC transporter permease LptF
MFLGKIERYILKAVLPYFILSLSLLTLILIIQQATRFSEIISHSQFALGVTIELVALITPGILLFTIPMAALVGASVGFSRLLNDSELTAIHGGGGSLLRIMLPVICLGASLTGLLLFVGFVLLPLSAGELRRISGEVALAKLASPVEPRSFFTGFPGRVIYVRDGDEASGTWGRIFIHWKDNEDQVRLITARSGRVNHVEGEDELYLRDAVITSIGVSGSYISEKASEFRLKDERLKQYKSTFLERLRSGERGSDELGLAKLSERIAAGKTENIRRDAEISLHRRLALCLSPAVLCFIGALLVIKTKRGGKVNGLILSTTVMLGYYLLFILGEQSARGGLLSPRLGLWLAPATFALAGGLLTLAHPGAGTIRWRMGFRGSERSPRNARRLGRASVTPFLGILDRYILKTLTGIFAASSLLLLSIFLIFTTFELLRFIAANDISSRVVLRYLLLLIPYASLNVMPVCALISVLLCFTLMARRSEAVIWLAAGVSAFRLILPAALFSLVVGAGLWLLQETILPQTNRVQNDLRSYIRTGGGAHRGQQGDRWFGAPGENRIYSLGSESGLREGRYKGVSIYVFDDEGVHLRRVLTGGEMEVTPDGRARLFDGRVYDLSDGHLTVSEYDRHELPGLLKNVLNEGGLGHDELSTKQLSDTLRLLNLDPARSRALSVALEVRRSTPFIPLILASVAAPLAFLYTRQKFLAGVVYSITLSLTFLAATRGFQTLGVNGLLPPAVAAWASPAIFSALGAYLSGKMKT